MKCYNDLKTSEVETAFPVSANIKLLTISTSIKIDQQ